MSIARRTFRSLDHDRGPADRARRALLAVSLVVAPLLLAVSDLIAPTVDWNSKADIVAKATGDPGLWQTYNLIAMAGFLLLVPAIIAAAELVRRAYARTALAIVMLVSVSAILIFGAIFSETLLAGAGGVESGAMAQYLAQVDDLAAMGVLFPLFFGSFIGYGLLAFTLWRSKATPVWVPVLLIVAFATLFFTEQNLVSGIAGIGLAVASFGMARAYVTGEEEPAPAVLPRVVDAAA